MHLAKSAGAQILITGDIGYHLAREAEYLGICLIDAGHFGTEFPVLADLSERLSVLALEKGYDVTFEVLPGESDPWSTMEE